MNYRAAASGVAIAALAATLAACGHPAPAASPHWVSRYSAVTDGPVTPAGRKIALAYMKSHPAPPRKGMVAGIVIENTVYGSDLWTALSMTVLTAQGRTATVYCGDPRTQADCKIQKGESTALGSYMLNGEYLYVRADGHGNAPGDYQLIRWTTVRLPQLCSLGYRSDGGPAPGERCTGGFSARTPPGASS